MYETNTGREQKGQTVYILLLYNLRCFQSMCLCDSLPKHCPPPPPPPPHSKTPSSCLPPSTFLLLCKALLWADCISICAKPAISSCLLTPLLVPAKGDSSCSGLCRVWHTGLNFLHTNYWASL